MYLLLKLAPGPPLLLLPLVMVVATASVVFAQIALVLGVDKSAAR